MKFSQFLIIWGMGSGMVFALVSIVTSYDFQLESDLDGFKTYGPIPQSDLITTYGNNAISWESSDLLKWSNFKVQVTKNPFETAYTSTFALHSFDFKCTGTLPDLVTNVTQVRIGAFFDKSNSWVDPNFLNHTDQNSLDYVLKHEQGHFDLAEERIRVIYHDMKNATKFLKYSCGTGTPDDRANARKMLDRSFSEIFNATWYGHYLSDKRYDEITSHDLTPQYQYIYNEFYDKLR